MTTPDFRALCLELLPHVDWDGDVEGPIVERARAALAQPVGDGPSGEELLKTYCDTRRAFYFEAAEGESDHEDRKAATIAGLRAVLARWGTPNLTQVRSSLGASPAPKAGESLS